MSNSDSSVREMLLLFENHKKLSDVLKEKSTAAAGGKKPKTNAKTPTSLLSLKMVTQTLEVMLR